MPILPRQSLIPSDPTSPTPSDPPSGGDPQPSQQSPAPQPPPQSQPSKPATTRPTPTRSDPPTEPSNPGANPPQAPSAPLSQPASARSSTTPTSITNAVVPTVSPPPLYNPQSTPVYYTPTRSRTDFGSVGTGSAEEPSASANPTSATATGPIIGAVVGGIAGICILIFFVMFVIRRIRKHRDDTEFDPVDFRRSALVLDDPVALPDDGTNHTFTPRPPTMIERKMNTAGIGSGPGSRRPTPPSNAFNQFQEQYQGQYRDEEPAHMGYSHQPQPQDTQYAYQPAVRQYSPPPQPPQANFGTFYSPHDYIVSTSPPPRPMQQPVQHVVEPAARAVSPPQQQQRLVPGNATSPNRVSTATTYDGADPYGGI